MRPVTGEGLVAGCSLECAGDHAIALRHRVDIMEAAAYPSEGADVGVGRRRSSKRSKDIDKGRKTAGIGL